MNTHHTAPTTPSGTAAAELDQVAGEAGRIVEAMRHPGSPQGRQTDELVAMIDSAREHIAQAVETLRAVANETSDVYRSSHMVASLEALVSTGGWMALESETLDGWIKELETGEEV